MTVTGAIVAVAIAIAASPLMPIGPARLAEPHPGVEVNLAILGAGFAAIALLPLAVLLPPAWRAARQAQGPLGLAEPTARQSRPSRLAAALTHAGSVTGGAGVAMAFEPGHGRTAVPVRSALAGSVIAVAALAAAAVFGASLVGLVSTPHDYGQNWVQEVDFNFGTASPTQGTQMAQAITALDGYAAGNYGQLTIDGKIVPAIGLDQVRGSGYLTLLAGRAPTAPDEIAVGAQTLRTIGARLGQTITVTVDQDITGGPGPAHRMRVVGVAVLPAFSRGSFTPTGLGTGAVLPAIVLSAGTREGTTDSPCSPGGLCYNFFLLRYKPGTDLAAEAAMITKVLTSNGCPVGSCIVPGRRRPAARRHQELRQHQGHPARPRRGARGARHRHPGPRAAHRRAPPPPRPGAAQDPRLHQAAGARHGRLGGQRLRRRRAARRSAARRRRRPLGLGRLRQRRRRLHSGHRAARHGAARHPRHPAGRQPHRRGARLGGGTAAARARSPDGVDRTMAIVWLGLRADLGSGGGRCSASPLLLGLIGGVVLTAAAGARRTDTAYPRLLSWANATQVELIPAANDYPADYYAALAKLPQVAQLSTEVLYQVVLPTARHAYTNQVYAISSPDHAMGVSADKVKILAGRPLIRTRQARR